MPDRITTNSGANGSGAAAGSTVLTGGAANATGDARRASQETSAPMASDAAAAVTSTAHTTNDTAPQTIQPDLGVASQMTELMADQFRQMFGTPGGRADGATQQATVGMQAIVACTTTLAQGLQNVSRECMQQSMQRGMTGMQELQRSKTPQEVLQVQNRLARESLESLFTLTRRLSEVMIAASDAALSGMSNPTSGGSRSPK
jgi:hypothetical protein